MVDTKAYTNLATWFEYLNDDCGYDVWSQYLILRLNTLYKGKRIYRGIDIGCGSGRFTRDFQKAGYLMCGVDVSAEMLSKAEELTAKENLNIRYFLGDIAKFKAFEKYDFATAINDCFNYVPPTRIKSALKNVHRLLEQDGVFLFDISSERKFLKKIANTVCADDREDITYLAFNTLDGKKVTMDVTIFVRRKDGAIDRFDERHVQYVYTENEILQALEETGFDVISVEGHLGADKSESDRLLFTVKKR